MIDTKLFVLHSTFLDISFEPGSMSDYIAVWCKSLFDFLN